MNKVDIELGVTEQPRLNLQKAMLTMLKKIGRPLPIPTLPPDSMSTDGGLDDEYAALAVERVSILNTRAQALAELIKAIVNNRSLLTQQDFRSSAYLFPAELIGREIPVKSQTTEEKRASQGAMAMGSRLPTPDSFTKNGRLLGIAGRIDTYFVKLAEYQKKLSGEVPAKPEKKVA